jgi:hypothetical protein
MSACERKQYVKHKTDRRSCAFDVQQEFLRWIVLEGSTLPIEILLHLSDAVPPIGFEKVIPIKSGP